MFRRRELTDDEIEELAEFYDTHDTSEMSRFGKAELVAIIWCAVMIVMVFLAMFAQAFDQPWCIPCYLVAAGCYGATIFGIVRGYDCLSTWTRWAIIGFLWHIFAYFVGATR